MQTSKKGFTLIELLVVIAIIGILAGMVVINMQGAPNAAKDATIKGYLAQMRAAALIFNTNSNTYIGIDGAGQEFKTLYDKADTANGTLAQSVSTSVTAYCASAQLVAASTQYWCIDSTGFVGTTTATQCSTTDVTCQ